MAKRKNAPAFRVGLLGESPHDTRAVAALLGRRYGERVEFFNLVERLTGDMLENAGTLRQLRREYDYERPALVVLIRDLDALETDRPQLVKRQNYFRQVKRRVEGKALHLLNICTIEALIAADIAVFNARYGCACVVAEDVMQVEKIIDLFKAATRPGQPHYLEAHCAELLAQVSYERLLANCRYFREFDAAFGKAVPKPA